ncbi:MAG TPA: ABC transporter permease [Candidatus Corynebacterium avicola]|uniref:Transport permease protein n=1 Tax=Candidatus Corynebacterium avicola TaxID=2838527 RepID=A0A9D1UL63_9CORY|nr:ABC transporter permease [Candidatus Corynebacterium avicola]
MNTVTEWLVDVRAVTLRNITRYRRTPDLLVWGMAQPLMFVLLFSQVLGGAIEVPGQDYVSFLMAGIFVQTMVFGGTFSGVLMAEDRKKGLVDRFRTLPMAPSAVLVGRTLGDVVLSSLTLLVMVLAGLAVGWRFDNGLLGLVAGLALLLVFSWSFAWVLVWLGLIVKSPEALNSASFMVLFPLSFLSNGFVPAETMPKVLETFANYNPVSALVQATRELFGNTGGAPAPDVWTMQNPVVTVLIGCVVMVAVFGTAATLRFTKAE